MATSVTLSRRELHQILVDILGSRHVYFQPPDSTKIEYPCIIYERSNIENIKADNSVYSQNYTYQITVLDSNPDSDTPQKISKLPYCRFIRHYASNGLNHDIFLCVVKNIEN